MEKRAFMDNPNPNFGAHPSLFQIDFCTHKQNAKCWWTCLVAPTHHLPRLPAILWWDPLGAPITHDPLCPPTSWHVWPHLVWSPCLSSTHGPTGVLVSRHLLQHDQYKWCRRHKSRHAYKQGELRYMCQCISYYGHTQCIQVGLFQTVLTSLN